MKGGCLGRGEREGKKGGGRVDEGEGERGDGMAGGGVRVVRGEAVGRLSSGLRSFQPTDLPK